MNDKELAEKIFLKKRLVPGHGTCSGCPIPIIARTCLSATNDPVVVSNATSCSEVTTTSFPFTSWNVPWIHSVFANSAATISGVERAYFSLKKKGKIKDNVKFMVFAGDGGSYDIGLQSLSGAIERGHDFVYVCYQNEGYMNTGNQRSSATERGTSTTTTPSGKMSFGKQEYRKNFTEICIAHNPAYVAQASVGDLIDLHTKMEKAFSIKGPKIINVFSPCPTNMKCPSNLSIKVAQLATETNFWPLYEYENGKYTINYKPSKKVPIDEFFKYQTKYSHLFKQENKYVLKELQEHIDKEWKDLINKEKSSK
ncbi:MAG TPA: thiamine pyrophosphate-dependent enzyme [archaeon]|nr:thiamine pyrophosphate-dependent enzyme [archaeon]